MQPNNDQNNTSNNSNLIISSKRMLDTHSSQRHLGKGTGSRKAEKEPKHSIPNISSQAFLLPHLTPPTSLFPFDSKLASNNTHSQAHLVSSNFKAQADSVVKSLPLSDRQVQHSNRRKQHCPTVTNNKRPKARLSIFRRSGGKLSIQKSSSTIKNNTVKLIEKNYIGSSPSQMRMIKVIDIFLAAIVAVHITLSLIENEIQYKETEQFFDDSIKNSGTKVYDIAILHALSTRTITTKENILRWINIILIIVMWILNTTHYVLQMLKMRREGVLARIEGMWASGLVKYCLFETFIIGWFNPPNTNYFFVGTMKFYDYAFSVGSLICIIAMFKSYLIIRVYTYISKWTTESAKRICNTLSVSSGFHFAFKADLKQRPYSMLTLIFGSAILSFALALRSFEYFTIAHGEEEAVLKGLIGKDHHLKDFVNSVWITIITMTTVGYGDFVPKENYGRVICIISCIIGLLLVSIIVVSLEMITDFSEEEKKAYSIIKKINADQNVILKATEVIVALSILRVRSMTKKDKLSERFVYIMKLKQSITLFKDDFKLAKAMDLPLDQTLTLIQKRIQEKYSVLTEKIIKLESMKESVDNINSSQRYCLEVMERVNQRQRRLGEFLVDLNNKRFKNALNSEKTPEKKSKAKYKKMKTVASRPETLARNSKSTEIFTKGNDIYSNG